MYCLWDERKASASWKHKKKAPPPNCMNKIMITLLCSQSKRSLYTLLVTGSSGDAKCHISGRLVSHHELSCVTPWCVMCHSSCAVLLSILCIAEEDTALYKIVEIKYRLSRWHNCFLMGCIKLEGSSYTGFHKGVSTLRRIYKGSDAFSRIMSLWLWGLDLSTRPVDKCTSMGVGFGFRLSRCHKTFKGCTKCKCM